MNYYFNQFIFFWEKEEYVKEGIRVNLNDMPDNKDVLDLLLARPLGLFSLMDEECKFPSASDSTLLAKLHGNLDTGSGVYEKPKTDVPIFVIKHFAEKVEYTPTDFLDKNRNFLPPEVISVLRTSKYDVVRFLYNCPLSRNGRLCCNPDQKTLTSEIGHSQTRAQQTLSTFFRYSLIDLLRSTLDGSPHFIKCFRPNLTQKPNDLDLKYLKKQLNYSGVYQTVKAIQDGYSTRLCFGEFLRRYCFLGFSFDERVVATKENCQLLLLRLKMDGFAIGRTKVFLKYFHIEYLSKLYEYQIRKIIQVQGVVRRWLAKINAQKMRWGVARTMLLSRIFFTRWKNRTKINPALRSNVSTAIIQDDNNVVTPPLVEKNIDEDHKIRSEAALEIQRHIRGFITRKKIGPILAAKLSKLAERGEDETKEQEIQDLKGELEEEGLSTDEAARLIQSVFRKRKINRMSSKYKKFSSPLSPEKIEALTMELMQDVHLNNVEAHKFLRDNKVPVDLEDVKIVNCTDPLTALQRRRGSRQIQPPPSHLKSVVVSNAIFRNKRRFSLTHFYSDTGPRESWDGPLNRHAKQNATAFKQANKKPSSNRQTIIPQSALNQNVADNIISTMQAEIRRRSLDRSTSPLRGGPGNFNGKRETGNLIEQMHSLKRTSNNAEDEGPFDFRTLLRKTDFAPTNSLRLRKGIRNPAEDIQFSTDVIDL